MHFFKSVKGSFFHDFNYLFRDKPDSGAFPFHGMAAVIGGQGTGKTLVMAIYLAEITKLYPTVRVVTNMSFNYDNLPWFKGQVYRWRTMEEKKRILNHLYDEEDDTANYPGILALSDEQHFTINSLDSKNLEAEDYALISTYRKRRLLELYSTQVLTRVGLTMREQLRYILSPKTLLGYSFVPIFDGSTYTVDTDQDQKEVTADRIGLKVFAHNLFYYSLYDTFEVVKGPRVFLRKGEYEDYRDYVDGLKLVEFLEYDGAVPAYYSNYLNVIDD